MDKKRLEGRMTISVIRGTEVPFIRVQLEDAASGASFLAAEVSLENFARMVTGQGHIPCEFVLRGTELLGLKKEVKTVMVPIPRMDGLSEDRREQMVRDYFAPFETEGWAGRVSDAFNWHNRIRGDEFMETFKVTFVRYVEMTNDGKNSPADTAHIFEQRG